MLLESLLLTCICGISLLLNVHIDVSSEEVSDLARGTGCTAETEGIKKLAWLKWNNVLASLDKGGLDIGSLKAFNLALIQKWRWRLMQNPDAICVRLIKAIHGPDAGFDLHSCNTQGLWTKIVGSINHLHSSGIIPLQSLRFKVGCGSKIRFWKDTWIGDGLLYLRYNRLFRLDSNADCFMRGRISNGHWEWNWSRNLGGRHSEAFNVLLFELVNVEVGSGNKSSGLIIGALLLQENLAWYNLLYNNVFKGFMSVNVTVGEKEDRMMITGLHTVADIFCVGCGSIVGWKYESACEKGQKYKEGKFILERFKVLGPDGSAYVNEQDLQIDGSDSEDE
ncbi:RNA-directed DNA polymerase, eukaryota, reverse transcriptase zinc-binding domain protein [Tanacetum coccineum]